MKKRILISIVLSIVTFCLWAEDISVVIPTSKDTNYALYPVSTGVFLRHSRPLASDNKAGRFELYPTDNSWGWVLFDTTTGEAWLLRWSAKNDILTKINLEI